MSAEEDRQPSSTVLPQASAPAEAVFLSYASEDADATERIARALRGAGIQVRFDKSELRGGDTWGGLGCDAPHKIVEFVLPSGTPVTLQFSGSNAATAKLAVTHSSVLTP